MTAHTYPTPRRIFTIDPDTGAWGKGGGVVHTLTAEEGHRIAASVVPGLTPELVAALDRVVTDDRASAPFERVQAFVAAAIANGCHDLIAEAGGQMLTLADVRDLVNEGIAWAAWTAALRTRIDQLTEDLQAFIDPAPQDQTGGNA